MADLLASSMPSVALQGACTTLGELRLEAAIDRPAAIPDWLDRRVDAFERNDREALTVLSLHMLRVRGGRIIEFTMFLETGRLFPLFGLPPTVS